MRFPEDLLGPPGGSTGCGNSPRRERTHGSEGLVRLQGHRGKDGPGRPSATQRVPAFTATPGSLPRAERPGSGRVRAAACDRRSLVEGILTWGHVESPSPFRFFAPRVRGVREASGDHRRAVSASFRTRLRLTRRLPAAWSQRPGLCGFVPAERPHGGAGLKTIRRRLPSATRWARPTPGTRGDVVWWLFPGPSGARGLAGVRGPFGPDVLLLI